MIRSRSSPTGGLEGRSIDIAPSRPVGRLGTWDLQLDSEPFDVGDARGPTKGALGAERIP